MVRRFSRCAVVVLCFAGIGAQAADGDRDAVVRALLDRSRLLEDARFRIPVELWRQYRRDIGAEAAAPVPTPVPMVAAEGVYAITEVGTPPAVSITATIRLTVFDPDRCRNTPVLSADRTWKKVAVNGKPAELAETKGYLVFSPGAPGRYTITATAPLKPLASYANGFRLNVPRTVRTLVHLDSPTAWELAGDADGRGIVGDADKGTHGILALSPRTRLTLRIQRPAPRRLRPPRYELRGPVAWNIDAGRQEVSARLNVAILGGQTDRLDLRIPAEAVDVRITGPDVRDRQRSGSTATVFLRGRIGEKTRLAIAYDLPAAGENATLAPPGIADGNWAGGTLVVCNTAGGSELIPGRTVGLRALALADVPAAAKPILAGPAVMAYDVTGRQWSAAVEVLDLGEFALRETIIDLAHFELLLQPDGSLLCKAAYEVRNRTKQFLRIRLPAGATPLLARVSEKPRPLAAVAGQPGTYLLPLERSTASVKGLVSFPVDLVVLMRIPALQRKGVSSIPLPRVDLPIAYAWCEAYLPGGMAAKAWSGPLRKVDRYANETAVAQLGYGRGEAVEGYTPMARAGDLPPASPPSGEGESKPTEEPSSGRTPGEDGNDVWSRPTPGDGKTGLDVVKSKLGVNYYRAGKELYERGDLAEAAESLNNAIRLSPDKVTVDNAKRLLSNIEVAQGKAALKSRGEKAAGAQVRQQVTALNSLQLDSQQVLVEKGMALAREGKSQQAQQQFAAAEQMSKKLIARGVDAKEQHALLRDVRAKLGEYSEQQKAQAEALQDRFEELKSKGRYEDALEAGRKLRILSLEVNANDGGFKYADEGLTKELDELAVKVARQKSYGSSTGTQAGPAPGAAPQPDRPGGGQRQASAEAPIARVPTHPGRGRAEGNWAATQGDRDGQPRAEPELVKRPLEALQAAEAEQRLETIEGTRVFTDGTPPTPARSPHSFTTGVHGSYGGNRRPGSSLAGRAADAIPSATIGGVAGRSGPAADDLAGALNRPPGLGTTGGTVVRAYDVRDLVTSPGPAGGEEDSKARKDRLLKAVRDALDADKQSGGDEAGKLVEANGRIVVAGPLDGQKRVAEVLNQLRRASGPQVEIGANIGGQRAEGLIGGGGGGGGWHGGAVNAPADGGRVGHATVDGVDNSAPELQRFIRENYKWLDEVRKPGQSGGGKGGGDVETGFMALPTVTSQPVAPVQTEDELVDRLRRNWGQKIPIGSINVNVDQGGANDLGIHFIAGNNGVSYSVIDEAQFRTLMELDSSNRQSGRVLDANWSKQDAIVGTDAMLANRWLANAAFAADTYNTIDVNNNPIVLPHEKYILINNGSFLTAVRAGEMTHWRKKSEVVTFAAAPQSIEVPSIGRQYKLEKTLVDPTDDLTIRITYSWKGDGE